VRVLSHPYRLPPEPAPAAPRARGGEEPVIYTGLAVLGLGRVLIAAAMAEPFGPEVTIAAAFGLAGVTGLVRLVRRRR